MSGSRQIQFEPTDVLRGKSAVYGLNGLRPTLRVGAAGKDLQVMVDYNQSLSVPEAIGRVQLLEEEARWTS